MLNADVDEHAEYRASKLLDDRIQHPHQVRRKFAQLARRKRLQDRNLPRLYLVGTNVTIRLANLTRCEFKHEWDKDKVWM